MEKKIKVATILQFAAAALYVLAMLFIYLDAAKWKIGIPQMEGWEGLGIAVILALAIIFQFTTSGVAAIFHAVAGACLRSSGGMVHKAVRVLLTVFGIIALLVNAYFIYCYFTIECVLWGIVSLMAALLSLVAMVALLTCKQTKDVPVLENAENIEIIQ